MAAQLMKLCSSGRVLVPLFVVGFLAATTVLYQFQDFPSGRFYSSVSWPKSPHSGNLMMNSSFDLEKGVDISASNLEEEGTPHHERRSVTRNDSSMENEAEQFYVFHSNTTQNNDQKHLASLNLEYNSSVTVSTNNFTVVRSTPMDRVEVLINRSNTSASKSNSHTNRSKRAVELQGNLKNDSFNIEKYLRRMRRVNLITLLQMKSMLLSSPKYSKSVV